MIKGSEHGAIGAGVRVAGGRGTTAVDRYWGGHTVEERTFTTVEASVRQLQWRFGEYPLFREFMELWGEHDGETILDYGCGPGNDVAGFLLYTGAARVIGIDVSERALRLAAARVVLHDVDESRVELIQSSDSSDAIPLADDSVDFVNCGGVLHHASRPEALVRELRRVLRPGGRANVMVYNRNSIWYHLYTAYVGAILEGTLQGLDPDEAFRRNTDGPECPISRAYEPRVFIELCEGAGFSVEYVGGYHSRIELDCLERHLEAAKRDDRLPDEHRAFLEGLVPDARGLPLFAGKHAGIGGSYRLRNAGAARKKSASGVVGRADGTRLGRARIVELVPHEPLDDPRIGWVTAMCAELAPTDVLAATWTTTRRSREYDGRVYLERANVEEVASPRARSTAKILAHVRHRFGWVGEFASTAAALNVLIDALRQRARGLSVPPALVVCHDVYALAGGVALKQIYGTPLVYDSHEFWPEANLDAPPWEQKLMRMYEGRLIQHADAVVTVSPGLARHLETTYGLDGVVVAPNAVPFRAELAPSFRRAVAQPVSFLLQGQVAPGRGLEWLLDAWARVDDERAVLFVRAPENAYLSELRSRVARAVERGRIAFLPPVDSDQLIEAARVADVGVIPYSGTNVNHRYACPNKLSQYMHAGLAVLSNETEFVSAVIERYDCGAVFRAGDDESLHAAIDELVSDVPRLERKKRSAYDAVGREFNWAVQSSDYRSLLEDLLGRPGNGHR